MSRTMVTLLVFLLFLTGILLLQVFLSKRENKWSGRILPVISFLFSLIYPLSMMAPAEGVDLGFLLSMLFVWLMANIPTMIFIAIYFACREKTMKNRQLDKMNIQDLE